MKILIDGIDVTDVTSPQAQPSLSSFLLKNVERIEVLKGAQSTLYGGQASGGVISITSKKTKKKGISNSFSYEVGSYNTTSTNYNFNLRTDKSDTSACLLGGIIVPLKSTPFSPKVTIKLPL